MKDFKELIKIADAYGTETRNLAEKKEQQLEEGMWDDLVGGISNLAKKLGVDPATADKVANAISTQPEAKAEIEKISPTWNSLNPKDLISWGINIKIVDCPAPMHAKAPDKTHIEFGVLFFLVIRK